MASNTKPKPPLPSSAPPSKLNVQKFAESRSAELESLHAVVANRLADDFRSRRSKRRRTTAFDRDAAGRRRRKSRRDGGDVRVPSRRVRRREELKENPERGFSVAGDGTRRLRTHVWHAKRFAMAKLWGYYLPLGVHGRGRGSRALLKRFKDGVLIHDASYYVAVQLEGSQVSLLSILSRVLMPSPSSHSGDLDYIMCGVTYGNAMLHHVDETSKAIAPVTYMWRPCHFGEGDNGVAVVTDRPERTDDTSFRQLWVWIHASSFNEGYDAIKCACEKEMDERGNTVKCFSLEGQLVKIELMGSKAYHLLKKTLTITSGNRETFIYEVDDGDSLCRKISVLNNEEDRISSKAVLYLCVMDPHTMTMKRQITSVPESTSSDMLVDVPQYGIGEHVDVAEISNITKESFSSWSETCGESIPACKTLWDLSSGVMPPLKENILCKERHEQRRNLFCLDSPIATELETPRSCPIMLLNNETKKGLSIGWSVILPINWVKAFWVPLISNGGHAIGLREKHWVACDLGLPSFPSDFPDCNAYTCLKATEIGASSLNDELHPPAIRPLRVPISPPWECVRVTLNNVLRKLEEPKTFTEEKKESEPIGHGNSMEGFVARTACSLTSFMTEVQGNDLLLFPQEADRKTCLLEIAKNECKLRPAQNGISSINYNYKLCFLRVLLHAYKEGSFEEGAVICAPHISDITLWTSSADNIDGGLQISPSSVTTYFKEQSSGKWELHIPDTDSSEESLRLPIGFVTTGFVRGSKKLVAEAFCEAVLLAHLRKEQWSNFPAKRRRKEIYVLVRNLRSTAYRLALATIVLELQEDDLESF